MVGSRSVTGRAVLSLILLMGFYVLAAGVLTGLYALNALVLTATGRLYFALVAFSILTALAVLRGVTSVLRRVPDAEEGVAVTRPQQPGLWALVEQVSGEMGTRAPDELRVTSDVNAYVSEAGGLLGLRRGRRRMVIGLGLLDVLTVDGLRSVVAHEFGHYAGGDTRLGPLNYRAGASMGRTIAHLGSDTLLGRVFAAYADLYLRVSLAVRRRQELGADAAAVRVGGRSAHMRALTDTTAGGVAYAYFVDRYLRPIWEAGRAPRNVHDGFRRLWAAVNDHPELLGAIDDALGREPHPLDSHPPLCHRLAGARSLPDRLRAPEDAPARAVLEGAEQLEEEVSRELCARAAGVTADRCLEWDEVAAVVYGPMLAGRARHLLDAVARVDGGPAPADLARLLAVLESDAVLPLAVGLAGDLDGVPACDRGEVQAAVLAAGVYAAFGSALVDAGARWHLSWSGPLTVQATDARPLDVDGVVRTALDEPERMAEVRATLAAEGVGLWWAPRHLPPQQPPAAPELVGVITDVGHDRKRADALLLDDELVVVRARSSAWERMSSALAASAGMRRGAATDDRLARLFARPLDEAVAEDPHNRRLRWDDVVAARVRRRLGGWRLELALVDGQGLRLDATSLSPPRRAVAAALGDLLGDRFVR